MKKMNGIIFSAIIAAAALCMPVNALEMLCFDFEMGKQGWEIPDWIQERSEYSVRSLKIGISPENNTNHNLVMLVDFSGNEWKAAITEVEGNFDLSEFSTLSVDIFTPDWAPSDLTARLILTNNEDLWLEMTDAKILKPGKWTTVRATLKGRTAIWQCEGVSVKMSDAFKNSISKIGIRVESDYCTYAGPVYIDNVKADC